MYCFVLKFQRTIVLGMPSVSNMLLAIYRYISRPLIAYMNVSCMFYNSSIG